MASVVKPLSPGESTRAERADRAPGDVGLGARSATPAPSPDPSQVAPSAFIRPLVLSPVESVVQASLAAAPASGVQPNLALQTAELPAFLGPGIQSALEPAPKPKRSKTKSRSKGPRRQKTGKPPPNRSGVKKVQAQATPFKVDSAGEDGASDASELTDHEPNPTADHGDDPLERYQRNPVARPDFVYLPLEPQPVLPVLPLHGEQAPLGTRPEHRVTSAERTRHTIAPDTHRVEERAPSDRPIEAVGGAAGSETDGRPKLRIIGGRLARSTKRGAVFV